MTYFTVIFSGHVIYLTYLFDVWPLLSYFGFLKVSWFAIELYLRLMTDQSILTVIF